MKSLLLAGLIVTLALTFAVGCEGGSVVIPQKVALIRLGVGSMFVFRRMYWDTLGTVVNDFMDTQVVYKSGIAYAGKDNVVVMSSNWDTTLRKALYYNYEPNGDFDDYSAIPGVRQGWRTYPISSKGTATFVQVDTTYLDSQSGQQFSSFRQFVLSYLTDSTIVEAGQSMDATDILFRAGNHTVFQNFTTDSWIAPSVGVEVRSITQIGRPYPQNYSRFEFHLVSYRLK